jgi:hypothetical protein
LGDGAELESTGLVASMSRKENCWDNAVMERFLLNLKMERVWQRNYANHAEAKVDVADYIAGFYNPIRLHSTLGYRSPAEHERRAEMTAWESTEPTHWRVRKDLTTTDLVGLTQRRRLAQRSTAEQLTQISAVVQTVVEESDTLRFDRTHFKSFGESSLDFEVVCVLMVPDYNQYMNEQQRINIRLKQELERMGVAFAHPLRIVVVPVQEAQASNGWWFSGVGCVRATAAAVRGAPVMREAHEQARAAVEPADTPSVIAAAMDRGPQLIGKVSG